MSNTEDGFLYTHKQDNDYSTLDGRLVKIIYECGIRVLEDVKTGEMFYTDSTILFKPLAEEDKLHLL
jgi:hypothetical protein